MLPVVIKYNDNYWVKFKLTYLRDTEDEGGGWYSYTGTKTLVCFNSRIKHLSQIPAKEADIDTFTEEQKELLNKEIAIYESSSRHKQLLTSNCKIKP